MSKKNNCNIGGQAVLEGVMMRGESAMATAVRNQKGEIVIESERFTPLSEKPRVYRIPIIRGMINFLNSMVSGMKIINRSAEVYGDLSDEAPSRFEKWLAKTFKTDIMNVVVVIGVLLGLLLAIGLFVFIPQLITDAIFRLAKLSTEGIGMSVAYNLIAGVIRMGIFIAYIALISLMKDVKRLFMYHGAEHKVVSCYESGLELTVENAKTMTTVHDRCGTTFLFIVMAVSILFFALFPVDLLPNSGAVLNLLMRVASRTVMIPIVAGISYEFLKLFAKYDNIITRICKKPGLLLQKLTTKEPEDEMLLVALAAFNEVLLLVADKDRPLQTFVTITTVEKTKAELLKILPVENEVEIILMAVTGTDNRTELSDGRRMDSEMVKKAKRYAEERKKGAPLQYILGTACFYGLDFLVDSRVLIPRMDTERLAEKAIELIKTFPTAPKAAELCTGSGAVAIAVQKNTGCQMVATDLSGDALEVARQNAERLNAEVTFLEGNLFQPVKKDKFDIILANPPYIQSGAIAELDKEVREYEPEMALNGGADGLDFYRDIATGAEKHLNPNGYLLLEVGATQAEAVIAMLTHYCTEVVYDYNTPPIARVVVARLKETEEK